MTKTVEKIIEGFIKFYIVYVIFGAMALIILYASADLRCLIETGESLFLTLLFAPDSLNDDAIIRTVQNFLLIAYKSVPGDVFFDTVLDISFDSNICADVPSLIRDLLHSGKTRATLSEAFQNYDLFWRDMAVATAASMVLYTVDHIKTRLAGKAISVRLGFALASVFWIFAGYTFAETITYALEKDVASDKLTILYVIIIITTGLLEVFFHAYEEKCSALHLVVLLCLKIFFNLLRNAFVLYMCRIILSFFDVLVPKSMLLNILGIVIPASVVIGTIFLEDKLKNIKIGSANANR